LFNTVYAPTTETTAESFLWYQANPRLQFGVAFLWKQQAFRALANWQAITETSDSPSLSFSAGVQGIGTGNPGFSSTIEKNFSLSGGGLVNAFCGIGYRSNESHLHGLLGAKWTPDGKLTLGYQHDGHEGHPFVTYSVEPFVVGFYLIGGERPAIMGGWRY
jgi:hypothetical protein